ncbi:MAG: putative membrane protein YfcA [Granulosicoccus sp.]|jgi:uncharacterized membrane protein YfcA
MSISSIIILLLIGMCAGILSGFVGVGGGMIIVPALVFFLGYTQHLAQGTSLAMMLPPIGILAVYNYYQTGNTNIKAALIISVSFFIGAYLGSKFSLSLDEKVVKKIFGVVMLLASLKMLFGK